MVELHPLKQMRLLKKKTLIASEWNDPKEFIVWKVFIIVLRSILKINNKVKLYITMYKYTANIISLVVSPIKFLIT